MYNYKRTKKYDKSFVPSSMMGPNAILLLDEITQQIEIKKGIRILDLGCGMGLTSVFLAKEYNAQVFAIDLWISATENFKRFCQYGVDQEVFPMHADVMMELPFAEGFFDALISIDSYHYFGNNDEFFAKQLKPILKKGAPIAIVIPGTKYEMNGIIPDALKPFLDNEGFYTLHCISRWQNWLEKHFDNFKIGEIECTNRAWSDWLSVDNPIAKQDIEMMKADDGKFLNMISVTGYLK